jgi:hypothetical protein
MLVVSVLQIINIALLRRLPRVQVLVNYSFSLGARFALENKAVIASRSLAKPAGRRGL